MQVLNDDIALDLRGRHHKWLVTGAAGFIGSHLVATLLANGQSVVGLDSLITGRLENLKEVRLLVGEKNWKNFKFIQGDIRNLDVCISACHGVDFVLHQAALGSVPRSILDPIKTNSINVAGFLNILVASKDNGIKKIVYAASSSTYGDHPDLPKIEEKIGRPLSPYAASKFINEIYADVFYKTYGLNSIGLRYFNVFGPRQDPSGQYAAVIPLWVGAMIKGDNIYINGDGKTSRDFSYIDNIVQANILAALSNNVETVNQVFNIAVGENTSLLTLFQHLKMSLGLLGISYRKEPIFREFRKGDVKHSLASIQKAKNLLGYSPNVKIWEGICNSMPWYISLFAIESNK